MTDKIPCESCSMPIESGPYCDYCTDDAGNLQAFEERFERMTQWVRRQEPGVSPADAESKTLAFMATMPAWRDHPRVVAHARGN